MPINPFGHTNPSQRRGASGSSQESQATQESAAQPAREEQARPEGAPDGADAAASASHPMMSGRESHWHKSLVSAIRKGATYQASLDQWLKDAPPTERRARQEIFERIMNWQNVGDVDEPLDLSAESLLEETGIEETITDLPPLPPRLRQVGLLGHQVESFAANKLPDSLTILDVSSNTLTELPENLPASLKVLYVANNRLRSLPKILPAILRELYAENNRLRSLPEILPDTLLALDVMENDLERLPETLPDSLGVLDASRGRVELEIPAGVLEAASREEDPCEIILQGTRVSVVSQERIMAHNERVAREGVGQTIEGGVNVYGVRRRSQTLGDAVRAWYSNRAPGYAVVWQNIRREAVSKANGIPLEELNQANEEELNEAHKSGRITDPTVSFWTLLDSLSGTMDAKIDSSTFRERVVDLLNEMENDKELRETCFNHAYDAVETCHDNVTLGFNNMERALLTRRAARGDFTPQVVFKLGLSTFKQDMLDALATQKAHEIGKGHEEREVMLYYRKIAADILELPHRSRHMLFEAEAISDQNQNLLVNSTDLFTAASTVMSAANDPQQITGFLTQWEPWQKGLARQHPEKFKDTDLMEVKNAIQKILEELMGMSDLNEETSDLDELIREFAKEIIHLDEGTSDLDELIRDFSKKINNPAKEVSNPAEGGSNLGEEISHLGEGDKMKIMNTLQKKYNNLDEILFGPERERLTREFVMSNIASGSGAS